jgi:hypothetical protein
VTWGGEAAVAPPQPWVADGWRAVLEGQSCRGEEKQGQELITQ